MLGSEVLGLGWLSGSGEDESGVCGELGEGEEGESEWVAAWVGGGEVCGTVAGVGAGEGEGEGESGVSGRVGLKMGSVKMELKRDLGAALRSHFLDLIGRRVPLTNQ